MKKWNDLNSYDTRKNYHCIFRDISKDKIKILPYPLSLHTILEQQLKNYYKDVPIEQIDKPKEYKDNVNTKVILWENWLNYWNDIQLWYRQKKVVRTVQQNQDQINTISFKAINTVSVKFNPVKAKQLNFISQVHIKHYKAIKNNESEE